MLNNAQCVAVALTIIHCAALWCQLVSFNLTDTLGSIGPPFLDSL